MLSNFLNKKANRLSEQPQPPKQYFHNFVAVKYRDNNNRLFRRVMYGSLCHGINIDLTAFTIAELESLIKYEVFPLLEEGHDLKTYTGLRHVRVWKDLKESGRENYLFIGDTELFE